MAKKTKAPALTTLSHEAAANTLQLDHATAADAVRAHAELTPREREVFDSIGRGIKHKDAAAGMGISINTLDIHRGNVKRKFRTSTAGLIRAWAFLQLIANNPADAV